MHFDLVDIRLFIHIAEANSLTRGADRAHLSLSAASLRIKNLEESLGVKLLSRTSHGVTLTPPGEAVLLHGRRVLQQLEQLTGDLQEYTKGIKGHIRVYANTTAMTEFLPAVMRTYLINHPDVHVDLQERLSPDSVRAVQDGTVDIGLVAGNVRTEGLDVLPYRHDRLVLATALSHPLAQYKKIDFVQALDYEFVSLPEASAIYGFLKRASEQLQRTFPLRIQVGSFEAAVRMIEANIGIGVLPEMTARRHAKTLSLKIIHLNDIWAVRNLQICVKDLSSLPLFTRQLVDLLVADGSGQLE